MSAAVLTLDATHAPDTRSWVESANAPDTDFPIQNLPFGRFRHNPLEPWQIGVAIGDRVLNLHATGLIDHNDMQRLMAAPVAQRRALRLAIWEGLREGSALQKVWADALLRHCVAIANGDCLIFQSFEVNGDAVRSTDFILATVATTDCT